MGLWSSDITDLELFKGLIKNVGQLPTTKVVGLEY
jgi:hypothetical protein